jgi:hypothetical protein
MAHGGLVGGPKRVAIAGENPMSMITTVKAQPKVLPDLTQVMTELARLRAENEALKAVKAAKERGLSLKVTDKGGVSLYGMGKWPVTLYKDQWTRMLDIADDIRAFLKANEASLSVKS